MLKILWEQLSEPPTCYLVVPTGILLVAVIVAQVVMAAAR